MKLRSASGTVVSVSGDLARQMLARGWRQVGGGSVAPTASLVQATPVEQADGDDFGWQESALSSAPAPDTPPDRAPEGVVTLAGVGVPDGTAKEVLDWAGDDPDRARAALQVEQGKGDDARSTLVAKLSKLAGQ